MQNSHVGIASRKGILYSATAIPITIEHYRYPDAVVKLLESSILACRFT